MNTVYAASQATCVAQGFLDKLNAVVFYPLVILLMGVALLVFLYGGFQFVMNADNPSAREEGRRHIIYGLIGLFVMIAAAAILSIATNTFGLSWRQSASGCGGNSVLPPSERTATPGTEPISSPF